MKTITNMQRAFCAETTLHDYSDNKEGRSLRLYDDAPTVLADLLADLMHYAVIQEIDFAQCLKLAKAHHDAEIAEEGGQQ